MAALNQRRKTVTVRVGGVPVGSAHPLVVQSMTNTLTTDVAATVGQIRQLQEAGADIVRVSCPDEQSSAALAATVLATAKPGDLVVCLGAGSITNWAYALPGELEKLAAAAGRGGAQQ